MPAPKTKTSDLKARATTLQTDIKKIRQDVRGTAQEGRGIYRQAIEKTDESKVQKIRGHIMHIQG